MSGVVGDENQSHALRTRIANGVDDNARFTNAQCGRRFIEDQHPDKGGADRGPQEQDKLDPADGDTGAACAVDIAAGVEDPIAKLGRNASALGGVARVFELYANDQLDDAGSR